jgi:hypothetical protein
MGLLAEIMSKNSIYGKKLDKRYVYIAACNPYRISTKKNILLDVLYKKKSEKKKFGIYCQSFAYDSYEFCV